MTEQPRWGIQPLTDKNGDPITGRQLEVGDFVLLAGPDGVHEVELTGQSTMGGSVIGFSCRAVHPENK